MNEESMKTLMFEVMKHMPRFGTHGFGHTLRVFNGCKIFGSRMKADLSILLPAALLHDVAREDINHAASSAIKARKILDSKGFSKECIEKIVDTILSHSFTGRGYPTSLEAKILSDVDKLDAIGAVGIFRAAMYSGEKGKSIDEFMSHFYEKLLYVKDKLFTDEAKRLAEDRHIFMLSFLGRLYNELSLIG